MSVDRDDRRARLLNDVFGPGTAIDPSERARLSARRYVRGLDLLTRDTSDKATGRRLTAWEAYSAYGFQKLYDVATDGSAIISDSSEAAGRTLRERREQLGISVKTVANKSGLTLEVVEALERSSRRPIREYERVSRALGLDERLLSYRPLPEGNERLTVRLRTLAEERASLSAGSVASLSEAAWVAMTQIRLEDELGLSTHAVQFETTSDFGSPEYPPYTVGYELADEVRHGLSLGVEPIASMRSLVEAQLCIPVVHAQLDARIAGATVESNRRRAIVLNVDGRNSDALVRRSTLAHEVGHLLFDPPQSLSELRVDEYDELDQRPETRADPVEQRANAFAVQLLAPQEAAVARFNSSRDLFEGVLDHFGVSFTLGRYQVWNGMQRTVPLDEIQAPNRRPDVAWDATESFTLIYHPIRSLASAPSRAGRFSAVAVRAARDGLVSWDTVAEWLLCSSDEAQSATDQLRDLYPEIFEGG